MNRRQFLGGTGAGLTAMSVGLARAPKAAANAKRSPDVVVVGAGTFGAWTAFHAQRLGANVTLLDAYGPGNSRASSGGETRQMQADRTDAAHMRSAIDSYAWWKRIEAESGVSLVLETGRITLSTTSDNLPALQNIKQRHQEYDLDDVEILSADELRYRWPQLHSDDIAFGGFFRNNGGCVIRARRAVDVVAAQFQKRGGQLRNAYCTPVVSARGQLDGVRTQDGDVLQADRYVFACGPWLPRLFPELLARRLQVQRRDVFFFGSPPGNNAFAYPQFPTWTVAGSGFYGFPDIEHRGFKVAPYPDYNPIDPDLDERIVMPQQVKRSRAFVRHRFPGLAQMPVTESRVCQITNTADGHFMAGAHPQLDDVWIAGGGSGHGFKHGPAIGEHMAKQVLGQALNEDFVKTFTVQKPEHS